MQKPAQGAEGKQNIHLTLHRCKCPLGVFYQCILDETKYIAGCRIVPLKEIRIIARDVWIQTMS